MNIYMSIVFVPIKPRILRHALREAEKSFFLVARQVRGGRTTKYFFLSSKNKSSE